MVLGGKGTEAAPIMTSKPGEACHAEPVWQVRWVDCGSESGEALTSIATDGNILRWSITQVTARSGALAHSFHFLPLSFPLSLSNPVSSPHALLSTQAISNPGPSFGFTYV